MDILRQKRLVRIFFIFGLCFLGLFARLWVIQMKDGYYYSCLALEQDSHWVSLEDVPRGKIFDRYMVPLTGEKMENRVVVFPMAIGDKAGVTEGLAEILCIDKSKIKSCMEGDPCCLPYQLTPVQSAAIKDKGWSGVMVLPVQLRYDERSLASHAIGHLGKISSREEFLSLVAAGGNKIYRYDDLIGKTGLEGYYEQDLKGSRSRRAVRVFTDARGSMLGGPEFIIEDQVDDKDRRDLVLTIDSRVQQVVEDIMDRRVDRGAVLVMEAGTGDILALASRPGFNPGHLEQYFKDKMEERFFDRCTALYQPGSVFKLVVAAAALEEGVVNLQSRYTCRGEKENLVRCWRDAGHGDIDFFHAFAESCNPVFAETSLDLGASKIIEYARRFGFDNQDIIGYPVPFDTRQDLNLIGVPHNLVNSSIGQGPVLVTPVQVAAMVNTVVSGGIYRQPRLVKEVLDSNGNTVKEFATNPGKMAISAGTAGKLCLLLESVIDEGAGKEAHLPVFGSAGKTGSAQVSNGLVNAWFTGYAPRSDPRYIVTVLVEEGVSGGESAAPVFREIMERIYSME